MVVYERSGEARPILHRKSRNESQKPFAGYLAEKHVHADVRSVRLAGETDQFYDARRDARILVYCVRRMGNYCHAPLRVLAGRAGCSGMVRALSNGESSVTILT